MAVFITTSATLADLHGRRRCARAASDQPGHHRRRESARAQTSEPRVRERDP